MHAQLVSSLSPLYRTSYIINTVRFADASLLKILTTFVFDLLQVLEIDEKVHLKFMRKCGESEYLFIWPSHTDDSWEDIEDVICRLNPPKLMNKREQFAFCKEDIDNIHSLVEQNCRIY